MSALPSGHSFICNVIVGKRSFRLSLKESSEMEGWIYSVLDVDCGRFLIPESPVSDLESGKRCAEAVIRENFAFSPIKFEWSGE
jgi:hypothetical protein